MTSTAITFMVLVCGVVWGGLATIVLLAVRAEGRKQRQAETPRS